MTMLHRELDCTGKHSCIESWQQYKMVSLFILRPKGDNPRSHVSRKPFEVWWVENRGHALSSVIF